MPEKAPSLVDEIKRSLRQLVVATTVISLVLIGALGAVTLSNTKTSNRTNDALCALRADQVKQNESSKKFLKENPEGLKSLGFTAKQIQDGIDDTQRTIDALGDLDCA